MPTSDTLKPPHSNWLRWPTTPIGVLLLHPTTNTLKVTPKMGYGRNGGSSRQDSNQGYYRPSGGPNNSKKSNGQHKYTPKCQIYDELGHIAKHCPRLRFVEPTTNYVATSPATNIKWLIDSGASHNITGDLANLSIHFEYDGTDEVVIGDGSGLHVLHVGSLVHKSPTCTFHLNDTL